jgi:hypothetical protein
MPQTNRLRHFILLLMLAAAATKLQDCEFLLRNKKEQLKCSRIVFIPHDVMLIEEFSKQCFLQPIST